MTMATPTPRPGRARAARGAMRLFVRLLNIAIAITILSAIGRTAFAEPMVFAAASTGRAVDTAIDESGVSALTSYAASGVLARQIEQGAPADIFISANPKWMQYLVDLGVIGGGDIVTLMSNRLVLIAPTGSGPVDPATLPALLEGENFAMADPAIAPVGRYGKEALSNLNLWPGIEGHLIPTRNTIATVAAVASKEARFGLVYASDAAGLDGVDIVWSIPLTSHAPIRYLGAPVAQGDDPDGGRALLAFLQSTPGAAVLSRHGFLPTDGGS